MDDWSVSDTARAAASGQAPNPTKPVTLTQTRFFMDDFHPLGDEDLFEVAATDDQQVVEALVTDSAHPPLGNRVRPRRLQRCFDHLDAVRAALLGRSAVDEVRAPVRHPRC
jgi:hypothetical protein